MKLFDQSSQKTLEILRIALGGIFLWAFFDKTFGLGFSTPAAQSWLNGVSPTQGYLLHGTKGAFAGLYKLLAGNMFVDWLFMLGLLGVGASLILGVGTRVAGYAGTLMMLLIYLAQFPPVHHPILDEHIVYAIILWRFAAYGAGEYWSLKKWWGKQEFVKKYSFLK